MADRICVDTDVLVGFLRNDKQIVEWFSSIEKTSVLATTQINAFELYFGAFHSVKREKNLESTERLLQRLILLNMSQDSARHAGECLHRMKTAGNEIEMRDIIIGCITLVNGFRLKTTNKKHFGRIPGLVIEDD